MDDRGREIILIHFRSHMRAVVYAAFFFLSQSSERRCFGRGVDMDVLFSFLCCVTGPGGSGGS